VSPGGSSLLPGGSSQNPMKPSRMVMSPGGAFLAARQFLGKNPEFTKIHVKWKGTQHSGHGIIPK